MDNIKLQKHFKMLAALEETQDPIISCYLQKPSDPSGYQDMMQRRAKAIRKTLNRQQRVSFETALAKIHNYLETKATPATESMVLFSRGGETPFFEALTFKVPVSNELTADTVPHLYQLASLKDTYHRYVVLISTESQARILEVCVGKITKQLWIDRPDLRKRVGREWTQEHFQSHKRDRSMRFVKEKVRILSELVSEEDHSHLIFAGNPKMLARIKDYLPKHLQEKLVTAIPTMSKEPTDAIVNMTLEAFAEHEKKESLQTASILLDELRRDQLAVADTEESLQALSRNQVDILVMAQSYMPPPAWKCQACKFIKISTATKTCTVCQKGHMASVNLKEEMVRLAKKNGATIEMVKDEETLANIGNVGCLLRYLTPQQHFVRTKKEVLEVSSSA